jgi:hypothetical protein
MQVYSIENIASNVNPISDTSTSSVYRARSPNSQTSMVDCLFLQLAKITIGLANKVFKTLKYLLLAEFLHLDSASRWQVLILYTRRPLAATSPRHCSIQ